MASKARAKPGDLPTIGKSPTGIRGLDEVTNGGLPKGRPSLLCGSAGCGKTLFGMTFLYNGAVEYDEPGVFLAFEERPEDLIENVGSLGYHIERLIAEKKIAIDHVEIERTKIAESGDYDLEGLFIRLEEQQTTMVAELNHRVKNILAIVQSVAAQTMRSSGSLENFAVAFDGRLRALAIAHDILTRTRWIGIGLSELLAAVLAPYRTPEEPRVSISGPAILLPARAVVPLSMVLHELTTNAAKYGALSTRGGKIEISWQLTGDADQSVEMVWQERNGRKVKPPAKAGFGTRLIDRVVSHDLDGKTTIDFDPAGLRCTLAFPVRGLTGQSAATSGPATV